MGPGLHDANKNGSSPFFGNPLKAARDIASPIPVVEGLRVAESSQRSYKMAAERLEAAILGDILRALKIFRRSPTPSRSVGLQQLADFVRSQPAGELEGIPEHSRREDSPESGEEPKWLALCRFGPVCLVSLV
jgi:hypothetical protein